MLGRMNKFWEGWTNIGNYKQMLGKSHTVKMQFKVLKIHIGNHEQMLRMMNNCPCNEQIWEEWTNIRKDEQILENTIKNWKKSQGQNPVQSFGAHNSVDAIAKMWNCNCNKNTSWQSFESSSPC